MFEAYHTDKRTGQRYAVTVHTKKLAREIFALACRNPHLTSQGWRTL